MALEENIKNHALELGFDLVGITDASPIDHSQAELLKNWLSSSCAAEMAYMQKNLEKRIDPSKLLENAQSVIVVALNYKPPHGEQQKAPILTGRVAAYACYQDYHIFIRQFLHKLLFFIRTIAASDFNFKICVDSAPLAERALAARAGLGFFGKNHMLINPQLGPRIFLAELITTLKLKPDKPLEANCADCSKCLAACPTGALSADGFFDAAKCISYLTIEHKGTITDELAGKIGDRLFGCDQCVLACPYQQNAPTCKNKQLGFFPERAQLNLHEILEMSEEDFKIRFTGSAIARLGLDRLKRNAHICLANLGK